MVFWYLLLRMPITEQEIPWESFKLVFPDAQLLYVAGKWRDGLVGPTQTAKAKHTTWIWKSV